MLNVKSQHGAGAFASASKPLVCRGVSQVTLDANIVSQPKEKLLRWGALWTMGLDIRHRLLEALHLGIG